MRLLTGRQSKFLKRTQSIECHDITDCDWSSKISMAKYFFSGRFLSCFNLAEKWAPEAIEAAVEGLSSGQKLNESQAG